MGLRGLGLKVEVSVRGCSADILGFRALGFRSLLDRASFGSSCMHNASQSLNLNPRRVPQAKMPCHDLRPAVVPE